MSPMCKNYLIFLNWFFEIDLEIKIFYNFSLSYQYISYRGSLFTPIKIEADKNVFSSSIVNYFGFDLYFYGFFSFWLFQYLKELFAICNRVLFEKNNWKNSRGLFSCRISSFMVSSNSISISSVCNWFTSFHLSELFCIIYSWLLEKS